MLSEALATNPTAVALEAALPGVVLEGQQQFSQLVLQVKPESLLDVLRHLKTQQGFERLSTVTAADFYPQEPRFHVTYALHSIANNLRVRVKVALPGDRPEVDSATAVYLSANWYERETYDLFGVVFRNHPNLTRIMMPEGWEGHPLRRDFPTHGHKYSYQE